MVGSNDIHSTLDALTGLASANALNEFLSFEFARTGLSANSLSLLHIDPDRFSVINTKFRRETGDRLLRSLAALLRTLARPGDLAARYQRETMVWVLPHMGRAESAIIAEELRRAVAVQSSTWGEISVPLTVSVGVASLDRCSRFHGPAELLAAAGLAVHAAKRAGRNCVRVFAGSRQSPGAPKAA